MPLKTVLFSFQGRIRRSRWWAVRIVSTVAFFIVYGAIFGLAGALRSTTDQQAMAIVWGIASLIVGLPTLVVYAWIVLATSVKRLHDQDLSGWFTLLFFIPYLGGLISFVMNGCLDGTRGPNKYGPSEKYPEAVAQVFS
jgi:uncharacterized membrane protein YhaH (DUF805 family)